MNTSSRYLQYFAAVFIYVQLGKWFHVCTYTYSVFISDRFTAYALPFFFFFNLLTRGDKLKPDDIRAECRELRIGVHDLWGFSRVWLCIFLCPTRNSTNIKSQQTCHILYPVFFQMRNILRNYFHSVVGRRAFQKKHFRFCLAYVE